MPIRIHFEDNESFDWQILKKPDSLSVHEILFDRSNPLEKKNIKSLIRCFEQGKTALPTSDPSLINQLETPKESHASTNEVPIALIGTSGSTSSPKLVPITLSQVSSAVNHAPKYLLPELHTSWLLCLPLIHMGGLAVLLRSKIHGNDVHVAKSIQASDIQYSLIKHPNISCISLVAKQLSDLIEFGEATINRLQKCQSILIGGGPVSSVLRKSIAKYHLPVVYSYGLSESFGQIFSIRANEIDPTLLDKNIVGKINTGNEYKFSEKNHLLLKGPQIISSYYSSHILNKNSERFFDTGDIGQLTEDGTLEILMRRSDLIVSGGKNLSPETIETEIAKAFKTDAYYWAAVGLEDPQWGEVIGLCIEKEALNKLQISKNEFESTCSSFPSDYRPRHFNYVEKLARTELGKKKRALIKQNWNMHRS